MTFRGQKMLNWSLNNYLGLANHPEVREADAKGAAEFGMAAPMGARSTRADTPKSTVMFAKNDTTTINVLYWGVSAAPVSRMELRKVSMLQAQKNARPR